MKTAISALLLACAFFLPAPVHAQISVVIDPPPISRTLDDFNDGVDTTGGFSNAASAGESSGFTSVTVGPNAPDPQFQVPTPGDPFDIATYPFFRLSSRGSIGAGSQVFPLPPSGVTVVGFNVGTGFGESQLTFITDPPAANGLGLRIDPIGAGDAATRTFDYDYIVLDKFETIGLAEYDRDGGTEGFDIVGNGHITNVGVSAATGTLTGTTAGIDPIMQRTALNIDTGAYNVLEIRAAFDPLSTSRFEVFWGTNTNPGPAGGQSLVVTGALIRDGELHTYRFQMGDDPRWSDTLQVLRIDPLADADAAAGRGFAIDYVRLIAGAPVVDNDLDGLPDAIETDTDVFVDACDTGTDPNDDDSDDDGFGDGVEVAAGTDPNDADSTPGATLDGYTESPAVYGLGAPIAANEPLLNFGSPTGYSVVPDLPAGLSLDPLSGAITGAPNAVTPAADYTITASFDGAPDSSFDLNIAITNPFIAGYSPNPASYQRGVAITANSPILNGAAPQLFSVAPPLPGGLSLDPNTGSITGTPDGFQSATDYTITASYAGFPDSEITLSITVNASPILAVDPAQLISNFVPLGEFNTGGDTELWASNNATITAAGGLLVVNTVAPDPQVFKGGLDLDTSAGDHTVLEFRLRQPDNIEVEFFWADGNGGLSAARRFVVPGGAIVADGEFHVYQIDMTGVFSGAVNVIRLDPGGAGGRTVEFDYVRLGNFTGAQPPRFTGISYDSELQEATVTWTSNPGESFIIEASADGAAWLELDDSYPAAAAGETTSYLDVEAVDFPTRIYRVSRAEN